MLHFRSSQSNYFNNHTDFRYLDGQEGRVFNLQLHSITACLLQQVRMSLEVSFVIVITNQVCNSKLCGLSLPDILFDHKWIPDPVPAECLPCLCQFLFSFLHSFFFSFLPTEKETLVILLVKFVQQNLSVHVHQTTRQIPIK